MNRDREFEFVRVVKKEGEGGEGGEGKEKGFSLVSG